MESNSPGSVSPQSIIPSYRQFCMSGTTAGHPASGKSVNPLHQDSVASPILPGNCPLVSNPSPSFASQGFQGSHLLVPDMVQPSPLLRMCKNDFPRLRASALEQNACTKKNELPKRKHKDIKYLPSDIQFKNIARQSKF